MHEPLYLVKHSHSEKPGKGLDFSPRGKWGWMPKQYNYRWIFNENDYHDFYIKITRNLYIKISINCHSAKIFNDHLVTYRVDLGTDFSRNFLSSSSLLEFLKALFGGITNDHDSSKEIMRTEAKSFDPKSSRWKQQNFCRLKCTRFLGFLKPHKNSHARVFSRFWNSRKIRR